MERELNDMDKAAAEITEFDQNEGTKAAPGEGTVEQDER
jgi:hypothetical protein